MIKLPNLEEEKDIFFGLGGEIQKSFKYTNLTYKLKVLTIFLLPQTFLAPNERLRKPEGARPFIIRRAFW